MPGPLRLLIAFTLTAFITGCAGGLFGPSGLTALTSKFPTFGADTAPTADDDDDFDTRVETPLLGDYVSVQGNNLVVLRGVGLVTELPGTGGDTPPSNLRSQLYHEMARRKIPNPNQIIAAKDTALVIVTAYLPAMVREGDRFDVRVTLPPNSDATSLKGGWLLDTRLFEEQVIPGRGALKGHEFAVAAGGIVTSLGTDAGAKVDRSMLRRGSIPGGAAAKTDRDLEIVLRNEVRSFRNSKRIATVISERFHHYDNYGRREAMADPKTDSLIKLQVHPAYRNNFPRYQHVIRSIAFKETDVSRQMRIRQLEEQLMDPVTAERAALQLEAIGSSSVGILKRALQSDSFEVRFHAAQSLAYMEDGSGVDVLKQAAQDEPAFRVFALAALSVITDAGSVMALRELTGSDSLETRYGAVRALKENSPEDPHLGTTEFGGQFILHEVADTGTPAVHVNRRRSPEIVIFGGEQPLRLPVLLNAGNNIRVMAREGDREITITRYRLNNSPQRLTSVNNLTDVIRICGDLGATYPDIVQLLIEADQQRNLAGDFGIDRVPQAGRTYMRPNPQNDGESEEGSGEPRPAGRKVRQGAESLIPGLFDRIEDETESDAESETALERMLAADTAADNDGELPTADETQRFAQAETSGGDADSAGADFDALLESGSADSLNLSEPGAGERLESALEDVRETPVSDFADDTDPFSMDDDSPESSVLEKAQGAAARSWRAIASPFRRLSGRNVGVDLSEPDVD